MATKPTTPKRAFPKGRADLIPRAELSVAFILTVLIVYLHVLRATHAGALWRDEVSALSASTLPSISSVWSSLIYESFPLLPYLVVRLWASIFTDVDTSLRILGALLGLLILVGLWVNRRFLGYQAPLVSLTLFALNPTVLIWGDSLRGYGLGSLLILLSFAFIWGTTQSLQPGRVGLAAIISILSVQCLYQNAFLLLAICLGATLVCLRRRQWKRILAVIGIGAVSAVSLLPYIPTIRAAREIVVVAQFPYDFSQIWSMFTLAMGSNTDFGLLAWIACYGIGVIMFCVAMFSRDKNAISSVDKDKAIFALTVMLAGTAVFLVFLKSTSFSTEVWYYIVLMSVIAISMECLIGVFAATVSRRVGRLVLTITLAAIMIPSALQQVSTRMTNLDIIASLLTERSAKEDFVVVNPWFCGVTLQRYYHGLAPWSTLPPMSELKLHRYDLLKEIMATDNPLQPVFNSMRTSLSNGHRVWLVGGFAFPPEGQLPSVLPTAPNSPYGWYSGAYLDSWTSQLGFFVNSHVSVGEVVKIPFDGPVNPNEKVSFVVFKGWRP